MDIRIYGTGSSGNSIQINRLLIDCGLTKKKMLSLGFTIEDVDALLITHRHGDHCNIPFVKYWMTTNKPLLISDDTIEHLERKGVDNIRHYQSLLKHPFTGITAGIFIKTLPQRHFDIINYAVLLHDGKESALYATDLDTLHATDTTPGLMTIPAVDNLLLEGNYDEEWLNKYIVSAIHTLDEDLDVSDYTNAELDKWVREHYRSLPSHISGSLFRAVQNQRHLSKQQARTFASVKLKQGGTYYEIHRSSQFYEEPEEWTLTL